MTTQRLPGITLRDVAAAPVAEVHSSHRGRYVELPATHLSNVQSAPGFTQALVQFLSHRME